MGVPIQSLPEYKQEILADIEGKTNQNTPAVPVAYNRAIANACAALALTTKLHNIDQRKECFPQTATEEIGLPLWADLVARQRTPGVYAELQGTITGAEGSVIGYGSSGPRWKAESGIIYSTKTGGVIGALETLSISVLASVYGEEGTLQVGDELQLTSTLPGVNPTLTVTAINVTGADQESVDSWRAAIIQKAAFPAEIGTAAWFYEMALTVAGISRAYPYSDDDHPGRVVIYAVDDTKTDGTPAGSQLTDIEALFITAQKNIMWASYLLPNASKRIEALASPIDEYTVTIIEGTPALSANMKAYIETALDNYFATRNPYINGLSLLDQGTVSATQINAVVQNTIDSNPSEVGTFTGVTLELGAVQSGQFVLDPGHRAKYAVIYD